MENRQEMQAYATGLRKVKVQRKGSTFQNFVRDVVDVIDTRLSVTRDTCEEMFNPNIVEDDGLNPLIAGLGKETIPVIESINNKKMNPLVSKGKDYQKWVSC